MGWWPSKLIVILNLIQMLGYGLIDCVVGGQILSAVSPHGHMTVAVGKLVVFRAGIVRLLMKRRHRDHRHHQLGHSHFRHSNLPLLRAVCVTDQGF